MREERAQECRRKAKELVGQMTLEEKVSQTIHGAAGIERLGIKAYNWWNEALHGVARAGVATIFPQAIGMAAAFDEELVWEVADVISTEGRAKYNMQQKYGDRDIYKGLTFWAPNVNIFRDPRWGRGHETFGEDPYLTSRMGVRFIEGLQGDDDNYMKSAACAKHFAVHSGPEDERHSFDARVSAQDLFETYLPAFEACVKEGKVEAVMGAYNRTNGEPCCGSRTLLIDILRKGWGFEGHVTSDCWAVKDFHEHHKVTSSALESAAMAMENGCDLNCGSLFLYLTEAVKRGMVSEERLDEAVTNLLSARMKLGLFEEEEKVPYNSITYEENDTKEHAGLNFKAARKSFVLLKNEGDLLPLNKDKLKTIGIIGPNANNRKALVGNYEGTASRYYTISEGIQDYVGDDVRVLYSEGCHLCKKKVSGLGQENDRLAEVRAVCDSSDVVIACLGLDSSLEGEEGDEGNEFASGDKPGLSLPGLQQEILEAACESGKPVILVILSGSALAVTWADEHVPAIIEGWYPGAMGGKALASVLFGEYSPEGKLPVTFYRTTEELPDFRDYSMKGRTYRYMEQKALYPFGYGLSYTDFGVEEATVSGDTIEKGEKLSVEAVLVNRGQMAGAETLQVYIKAKRPGTPNAQLKALKKEELQPGESKRIRLELSDRSFGLRDENGDLVLGEGTYEIYVGTQQPDERSSELTGKKPVCLQVQAGKTEILEKACVKVG
ncbi:glycoside hydrolase family 3 C-terminal domain-containing protein [Murimonas intestini]|uniref:Beta-glucosidase n=1 Tax=Murimonas intestini TaxID=1337051 RepID=A0AB73T1Z6_9FIRM|nr:glycoside hydrolase family 3 C-terminal domain-containing protein [Murimonas intestini]MCR1842682.1 glycoside hydrolase family 3 C-terminal domain-containing protein [Murimonas intestini]MCR1867271.1 glycoside hydrolase family 3 C-terminal domain-containing protein [Murimonas intestini]MCR1884457.1 glycoside hydrolase family 3 C-terminal domain-containing protein [Murimonas intestini]